MTISSDKLSLMTEVDQIESLLSQIPVENAVDRASLEQRLKSAKKMLAGYVDEKLPVKAKLTFRGKPVVGSHGIFSDFGNRASIAFNDAVVAVAAGLSDNLRYMGPIPDKLSNQLLITGIAVGSFGFEYELPNGKSETQMKLLEEPSMVEIAVERVKKLFELSATGSDDEVAELVDEIHPRAVKKVYDFLESIMQQDAWCGLEFKESFFKYENVSQLGRSVDRLKADNIKEREESFFGEFQGVLPSIRTFEFKVHDGQVIRGKVGAEIVEADILNREYLHKPLDVKFSIVQVGQARPRFTLNSLKQIGDSQ